MNTPAKPVPALIDSALFIKLNPLLTPDANQTFAYNRSNLGALSQDLLLYDRVYIPTYDFGIVPALVNWMGFALLEEAVDSGALAFLRRRNFLSYTGGGVGITHFTIGPRGGDFNDFRWYEAAMFRESAISLDVQLSNSCQQLSAGERARLLTAILRTSRDIDSSSEPFRRLEHETYQDVLRSKEFRAFCVRTSGGKLNLLRIPTVEKNSMRASTHGKTVDAADLVLKVAELNIELILSELIEGAQLKASSEAPPIWERKLEASGVTAAKTGPLTRFVELTNIPDIQQAVSKNSVEFKSCWQLRQSSCAQQFRAWLHAKLDTRPNEVGRELVESLRAQPTISSMPGKIIRMAASTAAGLLGNIAGLIAGVADSFFVERWLAGFSPRFFLDDVDRILLKSAKNRHPKHKRRGVRKR